MKRVFPNAQLSKGDLPKQMGVVETPENAWKQIQRGVDKLLSPGDDPMQPAEFMECYTTIINFCSKSEPEPTGFDALNINIGGKEMYYFLRDHLEEFLDRLAKAAPGGEESVLVYYSAHWRDFIQSALTLHNLFNYLNRMWIKRKLDEQSTGIFDIYTV